MATGSAEGAVVFGLSTTGVSSVAMTERGRFSFALLGQGAICVKNVGNMRVNYRPPFVLDHLGLQARIVGKRTLKMVTGTKLSFMFFSHIEAQEQIYKLKKPTAA